MSALVELANLWIPLPFTEYCCCSITVLGDSPNFLLLSLPTVSLEDYWLTCMVTYFWILFFFFVIKMLLDYCRETLLFKPKSFRGIALGFITLLRAWRGFSSLLLLEGTSIRLLFLFNVIVFCLVYFSFSWGWGETDFFVPSEILGLEADFWRFKITLLDSWLMGSFMLAFILINCFYAPNSSSIFVRTFDSGLLSCIYCTLDWLSANIGGFVSSLITDYRPLVTSSSSSSSPFSFSSNNLSLWMITA